MKLLRGIAIFFLILGALYLVGPRVENPVFSDEIPYVPADLDSLKQWIKKMSKLWVMFDTTMNLKFIL